MKIVINKCFGGFGLSRDAMLRLAASDCPHIKRHEPSDYYGGRDGWEEKFEADKARTGLFEILVVDGMIITDEHRSDDAARSCQVLVSAVEEMGPAADGRCAKLAIVEIPDDVEVQIDDYDGQESIHEAHRSWA